MFYGSDSIKICLCVLFFEKAETFVQNTVNVTKIIHLDLNDYIDFQLHKVWMKK